MKNWSVAAAASIVLPDLKAPQVLRVRLDHEGLPDLRVSQGQEVWKDRKVPKALPAPSGRKVPQAKPVR